jgi:UDP-glucose 4-epimerase
MNNFSILFIFFYFLILTKEQILITGGLGYIGSNVSYYLHRKGYEVIILDKSLKSATNQHWAKIYNGDYSDENILEEIFINNNISGVMHFGASIQVGESMNNPGLYYENNVAKTIILLNKIRSFGISKFIFSSSCAVYGEPVYLPLNEFHQKRPISVYGKTKLMIEEILADYSSIYKNFKYVALRYFNAAGAIPEVDLGECHEPETHLIPLALASAIKDKPFKVFGNNFNTYDGTCVRDYIHVVDLADAHLRAYKYLKNSGFSDCFNLGTGQGVSVLDIIESINKISGKKIDFNFAEKREGDPAILLADYSKAKNILKWEPKFSDINNIIKTAYEFHISHCY